MDGGFAHIRKKMTAYRPRERGDHLLNPDLLPSPPYRPAAVLIPLLKRDGGHTVLFTKRSAHLPAHAGQVSFPGGSMEREDKNAIETALREAEEEIGLHPARVDIIGLLDSYVTGTGFSVTPVVGIIEEPQVWMPDVAEVEEIFEVPLAHVLTPAAFSLEKREHRGVERQFYAMTWEKFYIWGATAGMLRNFVDVIHES